MKQNLTLVCKLQPTPEQVSQIEETLKTFADACNYANETVSPKVTSKRTIQTLEYYNIRNRFGLSANLAIQVCIRVGSNRKATKKVKNFKPTSMAYDARTFAYREGDQQVSITLLNGRERIALNLGSYQIGKLKGCKPTSAQLCKHRDGTYCIHIQLKNETPEPTDYENVIGVDFGRTDIAHTSEGNKWSGDQVKQVRDKFARVRASVQSKGTKSAKRLLKRLSGREKRFQQWVNHNISRQLIDRAIFTNSALAIEDLTGIRKRTKQQPRNKTERRRSNSWAFYQLRLFLEYKALMSGVTVIKVNPRYTSQTCHQCMHIGLRSGKRFNCGNCGWHGDADLNGALVIQILGGVVSHPESSALSCPLRAA